MNYFTLSKSYLFGTGLTDIKTEISKPPLGLRSGYGLISLWPTNLVRTENEDSHNYVLQRCYRSKQIMCFQKEVDIRTIFRKYLFYLS